MMTKKRESSDPYYDLIEDFDLIQSSFLSQYGIRLSRDLRGMKWDEFQALLSGTGPDTALGRVVSIRSEKNKDVINHFSPEHRRIHSEWQKRIAKNKTQEEHENFLETMKNAFVAMAGGVKN